MKSPVTSPFSTNHPSPTGVQHLACPQLPANVSQWSTRGLAEHLGVSPSTIKYHARQVFRARSHQGRWVFNLEQAQRVANHIHQFGQRETLGKSFQDADGKSLDES